MRKFCRRPDADQMKVKNPNHCLMKMELLIGKAIIMSSKATRLLHCILLAYFNLLTNWAKWKYCVLFSISCFRIFFSFARCFNGKVFTKHFPWRYSGFAWRIHFKIVFSCAIVFTFAFAHRSSSPWTNTKQMKAKTILGKTFVLRCLPMENKCREIWEWLHCDSCASVEAQAKIEKLLAIDQLDGISVSILICIRLHFRWKMAAIFLGVIFFLTFFTCFRSETIKNHSAIHFLRFETLFTLTNFRCTRGR